MRRNTLRGIGLGLALVVVAGGWLNGNPANAHGNQRARPYDGPIFDLQAHAVLPAAVAAAKESIRVDPSLTDESKEVLYQAFDRGADNLSGVERTNAIGPDGVQVVTVGVGFPPIPAGGLIAVANAINTWMATYTAGDPRLIGTATVPPPPVLAAAGLANAGVALVRAAIVNQGMKAIFFSAHYNGVFLGDPSFEPYFALAEELGVPVIIHPASTGTGWDLAPHRQVPITVTYPNDMRMTLVDIVKAGTLEKHPRLVIIATHLGGGVLNLLGRIDAMSEVFPADDWFIDSDGQRKLLPNPPSSYFNRIYYDINNADEVDVAAAIEKIGADHLVTGTDFPYIPQHRTRELLGNLNCSTQTKRAIAFGNAARLFGRDVPHGGH